MATAAAYAPGAGRSLSYDGAETVAYFVLTPSVLDPLRNQRAFNNHPLFSVLEHVVVDVTGSTEEAVLRALPIAAGAVTVALVTWVAARRWGSVAGLAAGALTAANPLLVETSREVRGYGMVTLLAVAATMVLDRLRSHPTTGRLAGYGAVGAAALLTHLAVGVLLVGHAATTVAWTTPVRRRALIAIGGAIAVAAVLYLGLLDEMISSSGDRGYRLQAGFPAELAREVLGGTWVGVATVGPLVLTGGWLLARRDVWIGVGAVVTVLTVVWVVGPTDLAPRFFVWGIPLAALVAARGVAERPAVGLAAAVVAVVAAAVHIAPGYTEADDAFPELAAVVDELAAGGHEVCVPNLSVPPLLAYTDRFEPVTETAQLVGCDVVLVSAPGLDPALEDAARRRFPEVEVIPAPKPALVLRPAAPPERSRTGGAGGG